MKYFLLAVTFIVIATPASAFYTECTLSKTTLPVNRPDGEAPPRWQEIERGTKVAILNQHAAWAFIYRYDQDLGQNFYGWLPRKVLSSCKPMDGTP